MGILNLRGLLKKKCGAFEETVPLSFFSNKTISIDANMFMCVYKSVCENEDKFKETFINLFLACNDAKINCILVFDGKSPLEKTDEKQRRILKKEATETRINDALVDISTYKTTGEISPLLMGIYKRKISKDCVETIKERELVIIKQHVEKQRKHVFKITNDDYKTVKELANIFGFPVITAPGEAEILCASLVRNKVADGVFTRDTDVLACCVPIMITEINVLLKKAVIIDINHILSSLNLSESEMLDLCIMCGNDYNRNIKNVGPVKALSLIQKHKTIEQIQKETNLDTSVLNYEVTRTLFKDVDMTQIQIPEVQVFNRDKLQEYIQKYKLNILFVYENNYKTDQQIEI